MRTRNWGDMKINDPDDQAVIDLLYELVAAPSDYNRFVEFMVQRVEQLDPVSDPIRAPLANHMQRAGELIDVVSPWRLGETPFLDAYLNQTVQSAFAIDARGVIRGRNGAANLAYRFRQTPLLDDIPIVESDLFLQSVKQTIAGTRRNDPNNVLRFAHREDGRSILMTLEPLTDPSTGDLVAIVKTSDVGWPHHLGPIVQDLFGLTTTEIDVVKAMFEGSRPKDIAERRQISMPTVRSQLRSIFLKTGAESQIDCMRLIFGLSLMHGSEEGTRIAAQIQHSIETPFYPRDDQRKVLKLPDGRDLDYAVFGDPDGRAVLFYHCEITGDTWFHDAAELARKRGLKLIAPSRPGYRRSTAQKELSNDPRSVAEDARHLLDTLGIERATILGVCCGFAPAIATSCLLGERIQGVTVTRPYFPAETEAEIEGFSGYTKLAQLTRLRFPPALRFMIKAGFAYTQTVGTIAFGKSLVQASPQDVDWFSRAEITPFTQQAIKTHAQGYFGTYSDLNHYGPWHDMFETMPTQLRIVLGEHDRNVQWIESRKWAEALPHVSLNVLKAAGYMVHHQRAATILDWIEEDLSEGKKARVEF